MSAITAFGSALRNFRMLIAGNMARVLLVEDNERDRETVQQALRHAGFTDIQWVMDGSQALEILNDSIRAGVPLPDAIILDLNLPLVSGHEVLRFCKRTPELKGTKVVVLSRLKSENEIQVCYYMGASRYIQKSSDQEQLEQQVRSALSALVFGAHPAE